MDTWNTLEVEECEWSGAKRRDLESDLLDQSAPLHMRATYSMPQPSFGVLIDGAGNADGALSGRVTITEVSILEAVRIKVRIHVIQCSEFSPIPRLDIRGCLRFFTIVSDSGKTA